MPQISRGFSAILVQSRSRHDHWVYMSESWCEPTDVALRPEPLARRAASSAHAALLFALSWCRCCLCATSALRRLIASSLVIFWVLIFLGIVLPSLARRTGAQSLGQVKESSPPSKSQFASPHVPVEQSCGQVTIFSPSSQAPLRQVGGQSKGQSEGFSPASQIKSLLQAVPLLPDPMRRVGLPLPVPMPEDEKGPDQWGRLLLTVGGGPLP
mmetsp:Transcript_3330/g.8564  ORF Transcript_3330/g.8564 Transcript_3330/m.8564 type:complete len:212 (-) Transcript_3330:2926-3561(-)